jgi:hypothetical protein
MSCCGYWKSNIGFQNEVDSLAIAQSNQLENLKKQLINYKQIILIGETQLINYKLIYKSLTQNIRSLSLMTPKNISLKEKQYQIQKT